MKNIKKRAFSLIELSIVLLIIGIIITGITQSHRIVSGFRVSNAKTLTQSSPVSSITGLVLWLETSLVDSTSDTNGVRDIDNGVDVTTWYDINPQSSSKLNFTTAVSPAFTINGINSVPSLDFTTNDYMTNTAGVLAVGDTSYTIFAVHRPDATPTGTQFIFGQSDGGTCGTGDLAALYMNATAGNGGFNCTASGALTTPALAANTTYVVGFVSDGTAAGSATVGSRVAVNSSTATGKTMTSNAGPEGLVAMIGADPDDNTANNYEGLISEVIVFDRPLKDSEFVSVMQYLGKKYGVDI
jgi:prepilin-type N-terminal cleavage/methylation domain-containing protein